MRSPFCFLVPSHNNGCSASDTFTLNPNALTAAANPSSSSRLVISLRRLDDDVEVCGGRSLRVLGRQNESNMKEASMRGRT